ncbi:MAG: serine/threonine-protein kinase [Kofleriaceae bacterium]
MGWYCQLCGFAAPELGPCPRDGGPLVPVSTQELLGRTLGDYRILAKLGGGAFGTVYRAAQVETGTIVAIKLLAHPVDRAESARVVIEARAASMIAHPNCVEVFDLALTSDRRPYIVMQLLDGVSLAHVMQDRLSVPEAITLISDVLRGVGEAHARGVVHRDLKPGNIFITGGRAVIVDFGFAKLISDPKAPNLSITGEVIGTPAYMAPEQIRAGRAVDGRCDLYAIGCVLYEMLAGRLPFAGKSTLKMFAAHLEETPPPLVKYRPDVPPRIAEAIGKAMAKRPEDRFADAGAMLAALTLAPRGGGWILIAAIAAAVIVIAIARC